MKKMFDDFLEACVEDGVVYVDLCCGDIQLSNEFAIEYWSSNNNRYSLMAGDNEMNFSIDSMEYDQESNMYIIKNQNTKLILTK